MTCVNGAPSPVTVAIIDDHDVVHAGVETWCRHADPPISVVGNFHTAKEYFVRFPQLPSNEVQVVLFDLQADGGRPDWATLGMMAGAGQRVIVFSQIDGDEIILKSLELGALTYLVKSEGQRHLIDALRAAHAAEPYVGPRMAKALLSDTIGGRIRLSNRENEVLVAWFQTESKELVAKRLHITPATVRTHLQRARAKYAAAGRPAPTKSALLARAVEDGILSLKDL